MGRYKESISFKAIERDLPHHIDMLVPLGGFGKRLDDMYEFHARHGIQPQRGQSHRDRKGRGYIRWCFADLEMAQAFANEFGGY
jgi:hypothetical protein